MVIAMKSTTRHTFSEQMNGGTEEHYLGRANQMHDAHVLVADDTDFIGMLAHPPPPKCAYGPRSAPTTRERLAWGARPINASGHKNKTI